MARTSRNQSNAQQDEGQHTAMTSDAARADDAPAQPAFDAEAELAEIKADVEDMTSEDGPAKDDAAPDQEMIKVKTTGPFMLHDPTTGYSVTEEGDEVIKTGFIDSQLELGRIVKA